MESSEWELDLNEASTELQNDKEVADVLSKLGPILAGEVLNHRASHGFNPTDYWEKLRIEFRKMICDSNSPTYQEVRRKAGEAYHTGKVIGLPILCATLADQVGLSIGLITPFVALLVVGLGTTTISAWCAAAPVE